MTTYAFSLSDASDQRIQTSHALGGLVKPIARSLAASMIAVGCVLAPRRDADDVNYEMSGVMIWWDGSATRPWYVLTGTLLDKHGAKAWRCTVSFYDLDHVFPDSQHCDPWPTDLTYPSGSLHIARPNLPPQAVGYNDYLKYFFIIDEKTGAVRLCAETPANAEKTGVVEHRCNNPFWPPPPAKSERHQEHVAH